MAPTDNQALGARGEELIAKIVRCPGCKRPERTLRRLRESFKCADIICDFCGYLAQVKTKKWNGRGALPEHFPTKILGAAWEPQKERMEAGIYFTLFLVLENKDGLASIYFLPRDLQTNEMFVPRERLGPNAKRAGWQGLTIDLSKALSEPVRYAVGDEVVFQTGYRERTRKERAAWLLDRSGPARTGDRLS